jgi:hypothetical protein
MVLLNANRSNFSKQILFAFLILLSGFKNHAQAPELWWMNSLGGPDNLGTIDKIDGNGSNYTNIFNFSKSNKESLPKQELIKAGNKIIGTTHEGGANGYGALFEYIPNSIGGEYRKLFDFDGENGWGRAFLTYIPNTNKIYGITSLAGWPSNYIFEYDIVNNTSVKKIVLSANLGTNPKGALLVASNGKLYGIASQSNEIKFGIIFEYDPINNTCLFKSDTRSFNGIDPSGELIQASNGKIYGTTSESSSNLGGTIFEYDIILNVCQKK